MDVKNSVVDYVRYKQLNWYGHIRRIPEETIPRRVWKRCPSGRRGRCRPRYQDIMTRMKAKELEEEDRNDRDEYCKHCNSIYKNNNIVE